MRYTEPPPTPAATLAQSSGDNDVCAELGSFSCNGVNCSEMGNIAPAATALHCLFDELFASCAFADSRHSSNDS